MKVNIRKADLDTCLTGLILDVTKNDKICICLENAPYEDLMNPSTLCIGVGGSGQTELNNFDNRNAERYLPPAAWQALMHQRPRNKSITRLVRYAAMVDDICDTSFPCSGYSSLAGVFSILLSFTKEPKDQFMKGIEFLKRAVDHKVDPYTILLDPLAWPSYPVVRNRKIRDGHIFLEGGLLSIADSGLTICSVESCVIGGIDTLFEAGYDAVILFNPYFGKPPIRKFTIAGNQVPVIHLKPPLNKLEPGWGGQQMIIGSPRWGTQLRIAQVLQIVIQHL